MRSFAILVCLLSIAVPCFSQTFTLDPVTNCPGLGSGKNYVLLAKPYYIEYVSGAWSALADDSQQGGYVWESRVTYYDYATGVTGVIGAVAPGLYQTPQEAEAAALGLYQIQGHGSVVSFYLAEVVSPVTGCGDNRGSVTLRFVAPVATQPTTWGRIKALYR